MTVQRDMLSAQYRLVGRIGSAWSLNELRVWDELRADLDSSEGVQNKAKGAFEALEFFP